MAIITNKFLTNTANDFITALKTSNAGYYAFMGRHLPWTDDNNPPTANQSPEAVELTTFAHIILGKKIANSDVVAMVPKYTWTTNTRYDQYNSTDPLLYTKSFYVITSSNNVYKCLYNNNANSTVEPSVVSTNSVFQTSDGYRWKFMYNVTAADMNKFTSNTYIPVTPNTTVQTAAIPGSLDTILVSNSGTGWVTYHTGRLDGVVNNYSMVLANTASTNDNFYAQSSIYLKSGLGSSQIRKIASYNGSTKTVVVDTAIDLYVNLRLANVLGTFTVGQVLSQNTVDLTVSQISSYIGVGNTITQSDTGATGQVATANSTDYIVVKTSPAIDFSLSLPVVNDSATITAKTGTVTVNTTSVTVVGTGTAFVTEYAVNDYIKVGTQTRKVASIANTTRLDVGALFSAAYTANTHSKVQGAALVTSITQLAANGTVVYSDTNGVELSYNTLVNTFQAGELVKQVSSSANGIVSFANASILRLTQVSGTFVTATTITGQSSNATANVSVVTSDPNITVQSTQRAFRLGLQTSTATGNATVTGLYTIPAEATDYVISPTVNISGRNDNAAIAYSVVNTSSNTISSIVIINPGRGYTNATANVTANVSYGSGANLTPLISPLKGHGADPVSELGGNYVGISTSFGNTTNESYGMLSYGAYRILGLIKNPAFNDLYFTVSSFDRVKLTLSSSSGSFTTGEVVVQPTSNAAGLVVYSNSTFVELNNVKRTFTANAAGDNLRGLSSNNTANTRIANVTPFTVNSNTQTVGQLTTGATGILVTSNSTIIRITNAVGTFSTLYQIYDSSTNAYANVSAIKVANNTKTYTSDRFRQTIRIGLSSNTGAFTNNELITQQYSNATAIVLSGVNDVDLVLTNVTGTFTNNELITQAATGANATIIVANSTFLKATSVRGTFTDTAIVGSTSGATANTVAKNVLVGTNVSGTWSQESNSSITGNTSASVGFCTVANTISYPDLTRNVGEVLYIENMAPITKTAVSKETLKLVIKF